MSARAWPRSSRRTYKRPLRLSRSTPLGWYGESLIYDVDWIGESTLVWGLPGQRPPCVPQQPDGARKVFADDRPDGIGNGWTEIQPGELVRRHPLPAGEHGIRAIEARLGLLPYLRVEHQVDDVAVGRQHLADDHQFAHVGVEAQLLVELAPERRVQRFQPFQPPARQHPVLFTTLAVFDQENLSVADDDRRHPQLRCDRVKGVHQGGEIDQ